MFFEIFLVFILGSASVNSWVMTDVNIQQLEKRFNTNLEEKEMDEEIAAQRFTLVYPGTKWCGAGSTANDYEDLGTERDTDICCRTHDYCPDILEAGTTKHNLTNDAFYTRLSCECDEAFRLCLRKVNTATANHIGTVYFNALATKCYRKDYPIVSCIKRGGWLNRKCLKYTYDESANKVHQWFDVPNY